MQTRKRLIRAILLSISIFLTGSGLVAIAASSPTQAQQGPVCQNGGALLVWVRGSGERIGAPTGQKFFSSVEANLGNIPHTNYELDQVYRTNDLVRGGYPAVGINGWGWPPAMEGYHRSRDIGIANLVNFLNKRVTLGPIGGGCSKEAIVLGGYSQGADVIGAALQDRRLDSTVFRQIAYVAMFGDPMYNMGGLVNCVVSSAANLVDYHTSWVRGNAWCLAITPTIVAHGALGWRDPYIPNVLKGRVGSWCGFSDPVCTSELGGAGLSVVDFFLKLVLKDADISAHFDYKREFIPEAAWEIVPAIVDKANELNKRQVISPPLFHGTPPDRVIVENASGGHWYVAAGGSLFWFNKDDASVREPLLTQRRQRYGEIPLPLMTNEEIHALEVNRDNNGNLSPGSHMPADNTFLREVSSTTQYEIKYQHPFQIGSPEELVALGGQAQAILVPPSMADLQKYPPQWVQDDLIRFYDSSQVWYYSNGTGYSVSSVPTRDCLEVTRHRWLTMMPTSARSSFPTSPQTATCDFPHGQWLYGDQSKRQLVVYYGAGVPIGGPDEVRALGGTDQAVPVSEETLNGLLARPLSLPNGHLFKAPNSPDLYQSWDNQFQHIGGPAQRDCLAFRNQAVVETMPGSFIDKLSKGPDAICVLPDGSWHYDTDTKQQYLTVFGGAFQVSIDEVGPLDGVNKARALSHQGTDFLERQNNFVIPNNELLKSPGSPQVYQVMDNQLHAVGNATIRDCFINQTGKSVRLVPQDLVNRMRAMGRVGADAACGGPSGPNQPNQPPGANPNQPPPPPGAPTRPNQPPPPPTAAQPPDLNLQMIGPDGRTVYWLHNRQWRGVPTPAVRDCLAVRASAGSARGFDQGLWGNYPVGPIAWCNYDQEPGLNFVKEEGDTTVWLVHADGTKQHVGDYCVPNPRDPSQPKRYRLFDVPRGETEGRRQTADFWPSPQACGALPG